MACLSKGRYATEQTTAKRSKRQDGSKVWPHYCNEIQLNSVFTDYQLIPIIREISKYKLVYFGKIDPNTFLIISNALSLPILPVPKTII